MLSFAFTPASSGLLVAKATRPRETLSDILWRDYGDDLMLAILEAIAATTDAATYDEVMSALSVGDLSGAINAIPWADVGAKKLSRAVPGLIRGALEDSGVAAAEDLTKDLGISGVGLGFSITRDQLADWVKQDTSTLISYITDQQAADIDRVIRAVMQDGLGADRAASLLLDGNLIGLTPRDTNAVFNFLNRQTASGVGLANADKAAVDYTQRLLKNRAETIAQTEMTRAKTQGTLEMTKQAMEDGDMALGAEKEWEALGDDPCDDCLELDGEIVDIFDTFSDGSDGPPGHARCQCGVAIHGKAA